MWWVAARLAGGRSRWWSFRRRSSWRSSSTWATRRSPPCAASPADSTSSARQDSTPPFKDCKAKCWSDFKQSRWEKEKSCNMKCILLSWSMSIAVKLSFKTNENIYLMFTTLKIFRVKCRGASLLDGTILWPASATSSRLSTWDWLCCRWPLGSTSRGNTFVSFRERYLSNFTSITSNYLFITGTFVWFVFFL